MPQTETRACLQKSSYLFDINFGKIDRQSHVMISDAKFQIATIDGKYIFDTTQTYNNNVYSLKGENNNASYEELLNILPENIKSAISQVNSSSDLSLFDDYYGGRCTTFPDFENIESNSLSGRVIKFKIPLMIKEVVTPAGYQSKNVVVDTDLEVAFTFENDHVISKSIRIHESNMIPNGNYYEYFRNGLYYYDKNVNYNVDIQNSETVSQLLYDTEMVNYNSLLSECNSGVVANDYCKSEFPVIEEDVGEVVLTIDNTVQEKHQISVSGNNRVQYKVLVSNTGNASSGNNIVKTSIPKEIEVVEDSISDDGVYSSSDRTIQWRIDYIDPYGEEELTYDVLVPGDKFGNYTVTSSVSSDQQNKLSISEPAIVNVVKNPHTGNIIFAIELLLIFTILFVIYNLYRKITKVHD